MNLRKFRENQVSEQSSDSYRFVKINGVMTKVLTSQADAAFEAAMRVHRSRSKELDRELLVHGVKG